MTLPALARRVLGIDARIDVKARLLGYILLVRHGGGWNALRISKVTKSRIKADLARHGLSTEDLDP